MWYISKLSSKWSWEDDRYCRFNTQLILWKLRLKNWDLPIIIIQVYNKLRHFEFCTPCQSPVWGGREILQYFWGHGDVRDPLKEFLVHSRHWIIVLYWIELETSNMGDGKILHLEFPIDLMLGTHSLCLQTCSVFSKPPCHAKATLSPLWENK